MNSTEGQDFLENEIVGPDINIIYYMANATGGKLYDFKTRGMKAIDISLISPEQYKHKGSITRKGKVGSARDFGNVAAGIVAGRHSLPWGIARLGFDGLQTYQEGTWRDKQWSTEGEPTQKAQKIGYDIGESLRGREKPLLYDYNRTSHRHRIDL